MSLRDYFAAKVVQGMMAASDLDFKHLQKLGEGSGNAGIAITAYKMADAMLSERQKSKPEVPAQYFNPLPKP